MPVSALLQFRMKTYSSQTAFTRLVREARCLYSNHSRLAGERVSNYIRTLGEMEQLIQSRFGVAVQDLDVLDIGPGQFLVHLTYFARNNRAVGIDLDVIARGFRPTPYVQMFRFNGARRTIKTLLRKAVGIDARYESEMRRQMNWNCLPQVRVNQMDACQITFPADSFDFVHSRSVFHHLPDPCAAIGHVSRILRPGGIAYLSFHLYTSANGSLDPRIFGQKQEAIGLWPHLRAGLQGQINGNAFVNRLRLADWRKLFGDKMSGVQLILNRNSRITAEADVRRLKSDGELAEYTLEELLTDEVVVLWRKPISS